MAVKKKESLTEKFVFPLSRVRSEVLNLRENGLQRGTPVGFEDLSANWTIKRGSTTYLLAAPYSGKTFFTFEILINLAVYENYVCVIYSPEMGGAKDIYGELIGMYLRKPFMKSSEHSKAKISDEDMDLALDFIDKHFLVIDTLQADATDKLIYETVLEYETSRKVKVDMLLIDSFSDVTVDYGSHRDISFGLFLTTMRRFASTNNIHIILTFHTRAMQTVNGKNIYGKTVPYYPAPTANDMQNGTYGFRKAMFLIGLWRPPEGIIDPATNEVYPDYEVRVQVLKAKPRNAGKLGTTKLYYDFYSSRFKDENGNWSEKQKVLNTK